MPLYYAALLPHWLIGPNGAVIPTTPTNGTTTPFTALRTVYSSRCWHWLCWRQKSVIDEHTALSFQQDRPLNRALCSLHRQVYAVFDW